MKKNDRNKDVQYRAMAETSIDGFWMVDMQGNFLDVNDSYCQMSGYSRGELLTMNISDIEVIEKPEDTAQRIGRIKQTGGDRFGTMHRRKDGEVINIEVSVRYLPGNGGRMVVFLHNIAKYDKAEDKKMTNREITGHEKRILKLEEAIEELKAQLGRKK